MNDVPSAPAIAAPHGFFHAHIDLPPNVPGLLGYFGEAPSFGIYVDEDLDTMVVVTAAGVEASGNAGVFAAITHRIWWMCENIKAALPPDTDIAVALLVDQERKHVFLGTRESLLSHFGQKRPDKDLPMAKRPSERPIKIGEGRKGTERLTEAEYMSFMTAVRFFAKVDGTHVPF